MEKEIYVPWGQITCKLFGDNSKQIVLLIHDIQDNAASFDTLITNLRQDYCYVAVDLPGHGKSSHISRYSMYHFFDYLLALKYVVKSFINSEEKIIILAHATGVHLAFLFAQVYPKLVSKLILLENVYNTGIRAKDFTSRLRQHANLYFAIENELAIKSPKEYSEQEVFDLCSQKYKMDGTNITKHKREAVKKIADRAARRIENGKYLLRNDMRLNAILMHTTGYDYLLDLLRKQPIRCPVLIIVNYETNLKNKEFVSELKSKTNHVKLVIMGDKRDEKDFHLNVPKLVAGKVNSFLNSPSALKNKL